MIREVSSEEGYQRGERYSIKLRMKASVVDRSSGATEGLRTMEDAQSAAGFGGQLRNVDCQKKKIMADCETQEFE